MGLQCTDIVHNSANAKLLSILQIFRKWIQYHSFITELVY